MEITSADLSVWLSARFLPYGAIFIILQELSYENGASLLYDYTKRSAPKTIERSNFIPSTLSLGKLVHFRDAGAVAGTLEFISGKSYEATESMCTSKGDDFCQFICRPRQ